MTADIAAAQRRSALSGIDPATDDIRHLGEPGPAAGALTRLSAPLLDDVLWQIADSSLGVVLADRDGRLTRRDAASSSTLSAMDAGSLDVGYSLAEDDVGTNGVGTSLATKLPAIVVGDEHHLECFKAFTCANAPIIQPVTRRVEGTVGLLCPVGDTGPLLVPTVLQLSARISELMLERATSDERLLLEQFLLHRTTSNRAIATIGDGVLIATPAAQRLLVGVEHADLWERVEAVVRHGSGGPTELDLEQPSGPTLHLRCRPVRSGGELGGATVEFVSPRPSTKRCGPTRHEDRLGDLVGVSDAWRVMVRHARRAARLDVPVLVVGERGSGRRSIATAIAAMHGAGRVHVLDSSSVLVEGARGWVRDATAALTGDAAVVLRRVDELPDEVAAALAAVVAACPSGARTIATTERTTADRPGLAALLDQLDVMRVDVPPLRERRADIEPLIGHLVARHDLRKVDPRVVKILCRQPWRGNVTELRQVLRSADAAATTEDITVEDLPGHVRRAPDRRPLHGLRQQEADAIVAALHAASTRTEAAALLGISRATLYRRIEAYGLDRDRQ